MIELIPFTEADIDRLIGWIPSLETLLWWTSASFGYPLTREHLQGISATAPNAGTGRVLIDPAVRGRGLGAEMMRAALTRAFEEHRVHRAELVVFDVNARAIRCYEQVGFRREGVRRDSFKAPGEPGMPEKYWSEISMSILAPEWEALRRR